LLPFLPLAFKTINYFIVHVAKDIWSYKAQASTRRGGSHSLEDSQVLQCLLNDLILIDAATAACGGNSCTTVNNLACTFHGLFRTFDDFVVRVGIDELRVVSKETMEEETWRDTVSRGVIRQVGGLNCSIEMNAFLGC
jgi:hypothetical protein